MYAFVFLNLQALQEGVYGALIGPARMIFLALCPIGSIFVLLRMLQCAHAYQVTGSGEHALRAIAASGIIVSVVANWTPWSPGVSVYPTGVAGPYGLLASAGRDLAQTMQGGAANSQAYIAESLNQHAQQNKGWENPLTTMITAMTVAWAKLLAWLAMMLINVMVILYIALSMLGAAFGALYIPMLIGPGPCGSIATTFLLETIGLALWPVAWALCDVGTRAIMQVATNGSAGIVGSPILWLAAAIWVFCGYVVAPMIFSKAIVSGGIVGAVSGAIGATAGATMTTAGALAGILGSGVAGGAGALGGAMGGPAKGLAGALSKTASGVGGALSEAAPSLGGAMHSAGQGAHPHHGSLAGSLNGASTGFSRGVSRGGAKNAPLGGAAAEGLASSTSSESSHSGASGAHGSGLAANDPLRGPAPGAAGSSPSVGSLAPGDPLLRRGMGASAFTGATPSPRRGSTPGASSGAPSASEPRVPSAGSQGVAASTPSAPTPPQQAGAASVSTGRSPATEAAAASPSAPAPSVSSTATPASSANAAPFAAAPPPPQQAAPAPVASSTMSAGQRHISAPPPAAAPAATPSPVAVSAPSPAPVNPAESSFGGAPSVAPTKPAAAPGARQQPRPIKSPIRPAPEPKP